MTKAQNFIALIGYRGTGKTTVARLLANSLRWSWIDADVELERRAEKTINEFFAQEGETAFRNLETQVVLDLTQRERIVLALGGGAVLREENRAAIRRGTVVWLQADAATIFARTSTDPTTPERRPNLTAVGGLAEIEQLLAAREPLYRDCADFAVATVGITPDQVVDQVVSLLK